jgi:adenosylcobinamide kinase/adenosylcobinamide-phosphate guanylyltransferase
VKRLWFILGGARSGKSTYALELAKDIGGKVLFVATATPSDEFMAQRINKHKQERPLNWKTLEKPKNVGQALMKLDEIFNTIIIDCLTVLAGNRIIELSEPVSETQAWNQIKQEIEDIVTACQMLNSDIIIVSNEVGLGIVPATNLGCAYRDALGRANCMIAKYATDVVFMVSGLPLIIKGK